FGLMTIEDGPKAQQVINATLDRVNELGTQAWTGYSFSWIACNFARQGRAEDALKYLDIYANAFILRNGFHVNGDQLKAGFSSFTYRPFTLEGNFLAPEVVHDMLMQSWRGVVRLFPAMPWRWHNAEFEALRAEGGWIVSGRYENNACTWLRVKATRDRKLVLRDNFGTRAITWRGPQPTKVGNDYEVLLKAGDTLEATLARPAQIPPAPDNAWMKLALPARTHIRANTGPLRISRYVPGNSLRLIHRDPHLAYEAQLPVGQWSHVAVTLDGDTGDAVLYLNGRCVASQ
ncbi:MAG: LamG domain-containing protein, partial [Planctomycetes bacterium]|nr:LamG domain-containing protein [Planctomycetota bacterium]